MGDDKKKVVSVAGVSDPLLAMAVEAKTYTHISSPDMTEAIDQQIKDEVILKIAPVITKTVDRVVASMRDRGIFDRHSRAKIEHFVELYVGEYVKKFMAKNEATFSEAFEKYVEAHWRARVEVVAEEHLQKALAKVREEFKR